MSAQPRLNARCMEDVRTGQREPLLRRRLTQVLQADGALEPPVRRRALLRRGSGQLGGIGGGGALALRFLQEGGGGHRSVRQPALLLELRLELGVARAQRARRGAMVLDARAKLVHRRLERQHLTPPRRVLRGEPRGLGACSVGVGACRVAPPL